MQAQSATHPWNMLEELWEEWGSEGPRISALIFLFKTQEASKSCPFYRLQHTALKQISPPANYSCPQTWDGLHLVWFPPPSATGQWKREKKLKWQTTQLRVHQELCDAGDGQLQKFSLVLGQGRLHVVLETKIKMAQSHPGWAHIATGVSTRPKGSGQPGMHLLYTHTHRGPYNTTWPVGQMQALISIYPSNSHRAAHGFYGSGTQLLKLL